MFTHEHAYYFSSKDNLQIWKKYNYLFSRCKHTFTTLLSTKHLSLGIKDYFFSFMVENMGFSTELTKIFMKKIQTLNTKCL